MSSKALEKKLDKANLPVHVAIIMDGNGRWARDKHLPRLAGHRQGVERVREIVRTAGEIGIKVLTLYAFSSENWKRPAPEVNALMRLLKEFLKKELNNLNKEKVKFITIGHLEKLPLAVRKILSEAKEITAGNKGLILNLALNYGGRGEIVRAARAAARDIKSGKRKLEELNEDVFGSYLYTSALPDPDLLIRTSGELRISNFLLYQIAYSEIWITPVHWPDFRRKHFLEALLDYQNRERRFGGTDAQ